MPLPKSVTECDDAPQAPFQRASPSSNLDQSHVAAILNASDDAIISKTMDGIITAWNAAAERIFGYTAEEIVGKPIATIFAPDQLAEEDEIMARLRRRERIEHYESVRITKDGRAIDVDVSVAPVTDDDGNLLGATKILRDISQRKRMERALRESETRHRAIFESSLDGIIAIDEHGVIESINPAGQEMFGYEADEVVGGNISILMPEPFRSEHQHYLRSYLETGTARMIGVGREVVGLRKNGGTFPVELSVAEVNLSGRRAFIGTVRDISDRKLAEKALMESEVRFRLIADAVPQLIWTNGPDGSVHYMNARWYEFAGRIRGQDTGWHWHDVMHGDDAARVTAAWRHSLETGEPLGLEARLKRASDGAYRWFLVRSVPVRDEHGAITQWIGTCTDIDDQKRAMELEAARLEAETANRAKSEFLANMSHEIRTPMSAILGYADLLLDPDQTPSDRHKAINVIRRNGAHLLAVINDILDLSKIEAGEMKLDAVVCSPCQIMADVASLMRVQAAEKGLKFELNVDGTIPAMMHGDPTRLRQILLNLVSNAVKFTECGWVRLVARMAEPHGDAGPMIRFEVIDTGIGMNQAQIAQIFQPFVQVDTSATRRFGGTGLGLAISRRLAHAMGGEINVDSTPGRGSLFALTIPTGPLTDVPMIGNCSEALSSLDRSSMAAAPTQIALAGRILLAEDGIDNQELLSGYMRRAGADVVTAGNGKIACQLVLEAAKGGGPPFDLIIMDMQMPVLDGYGATAMLRSKGFTGPIIALTANAMSTDRDKCLHAGCTDYLAKPVKRDHFLRTVAEHLEAARAKSFASAPSAHAAPRSPITAQADEILEALLPRFLARLPQEVEKLEGLLDERLLGELASAAHKLCGTAGLYKFSEISDAAAALEKSILEGATFDEITPQVHAVIEMIRVVQRYDAARRA